MGESPPKSVCFSKLFMIKFIGTTSQFHFVFLFQNFLNIFQNYFFFHKLLFFFSNFKQTARYSNLIYNCFLDVYNRFRIRAQYVFIVRTSTDDTYLKTFTNGMIGSESSWSGREDYELVCVCGRIVRVFVGRFRSVPRVKNQLKMDKFNMKWI